MLAKLVTLMVHYINLAYLSTLPHWAIILSQNFHYGRSSSLPLLTMPEVAFVKHNTTT